MSDQHTNIYQGADGKWYWYNPIAHINTEVKVRHFKAGTGPFDSREKAVLDEKKMMQWLRQNGHTQPKCPHCGK